MKTAHSEKKVIEVKNTTYCFGQLPKQGISTNIDLKKGTY